MHEVVRLSSRGRHPPDPNSRRTSEFRRNHRHHHPGTPAEPPKRRPAASTLEWLFVGREARSPREARTRRGPGAMEASEADATGARADETVLLSPAGFTPPAPAELAVRFPNLEVIELLGHG